MRLLLYAAKILDAVKKMATKRTITIEQSIFPGCEPIFVAALSQLVNAA
jgi:hypothetical protein